jgi:hypothetical protein
MMNKNQDEQPIDPSAPESGEVEPSATRVQPEAMADKREGTPPPAGDSVDGQTHMGASEDQVIRNKPPTGALSDVLGDQSDDPRDPTPNDELTPG